MVAGNSFGISFAVLLFLANGKLNLSGRAIKICIFKQSFKQDPLLGCIQ